MPCDHTLIAMRAAMAIDAQCANADGFAPKGVAATSFAPLLGGGALPGAWRHQVFTLRKRGYRD